MLYEAGRALAHLLDQPGGTVGEKILAAGPDAITWLRESGDDHAADLVAITLLVFAMFVPRHGRRDMVVSFLVVNIAVFAVAAALSVSTVAAGLGLGLFGVLSIIRLRSEELGQHEVAYYFAALALGLLGGLGAAESF